MPNVLITTPHSSDFVPEELCTRFQLPHEKVRDAYDVGTYEIVAQAFNDTDVQIIGAEVSRLVIDLNRNENDARPIGVCREKDFRKRKIYKKGQELTPEEKHLYIEKYHRAWHQRFLSGLTKEPLRFHLDLHNTNERIPYLSAYYPEERKRMDEITDFDVANRCEFKTPHVAVDPEGVTFPSDEIEGVMESVRKHMGIFFEDYLQRDKDSLVVTCGEFMRGGPNIQKARDLGNWKNGISRSLQFELQRQFFVDENGIPKPNYIRGLAKVLRNIIDDVLKNTLVQ
jgi:N-formylglutamate amidohydrolase